MNLKVESDQPTEELPLVTPDPASEQEGDEQSSPQDSSKVPVSREEFEGLQKQLRGLQARGDKNASALTDLLERDGKNLSANEVKALQQAIDGMLAGTGVSTEDNALVGADTPAKPNFVGAFQEAGFDTSKLTSEDMDFAEKFEGDEVALKNSLLKRRLNSQTETTGAGAISGSGGRTTSAPELEDLKTELDGLMDGDTDIPRQDEILQILKEAGERV